jgi:hypothetical protein
MERAMTKGLAAKLEVGRKMTNLVMAATPNGS